MQSLDIKQIEVASDRRSYLGEPTMQVRWLTGETLHGMLTTLVTPWLFLLASGCLMAVAWSLVNFYENQVRLLLLFFLASLAVFHVIAWWTAGLSDEKTYKFVDYIFLIFSLAALVAVVDVQSEVSKERLSEASRVYSVFESERCQDPYSRRCRFFRKQLETIDRSRGTSLLEMWELYLDQDLELLREKWNGGETDEIRVIKGDLERFYATYQRLERAREYVLTYKSAFDRFLPLYLAAIAACIRLTKVTAELMKWYRAKPA
ncbi:hypothetical protein [Bradyrhizobium sp. LTSP849]|uniref:hypothetical protein n=1 Tax=Bradyrhizobium sp. LTSP849 TaxID=1615890 RepID=UPI0012DFF936|nr:hypothetical protein [Bradyrhizobium sp. LTSP849]